MKLFISIAAGVLLAVQCFATGSVPVNTPQSGFANFTTNGSAFTSVTNTFEPPFTYPPSMSFYLNSGPTNALPLASTVTATNFILTINTATNCAIQWIANPAAALIQNGSVICTAGVATNVAFPNAYVYAPTVVIGASNTNGYTAVYGVTITNFTLISNVLQTNSWISFGQDSNPGTQTVTH